MSSFRLLDNFISRHPSWGDISNAQGEILNDFLQQEKFVALNDGEPTFTCTKGKRIIDLVLCNANLRRLFCGHAIDYYTGMYTSASNRGHYPVIATFDIAGNSRSTHVKNLKKTDWGKREGNPRKLRSITMAWNWLMLWCYMTCLWGILLQCISEAANLTLPIKQITSHSKPYFNEELKMLSLQLRKARKIMKLRLDPINIFNYEILKQQFQSTLMKSKAEYYKTCRETPNASKGSDFWKTKNFLLVPMGWLISYGKVLDSNSDKFERLRSTFTSDSHFPETCLTNFGWEMSKTNSRQISIRIMSNHPA